MNMVSIVHCLLVGREGFLRAAEGNEDLWLGLAGLVLDDCTRQVAEFTTNTVDTMQDALLSVLEIGEDVLSPHLSSGSGVFHPEVVTYADMVLDGVVVKPLEPFVTDELAVCDQALDAVASEQSDEPLHDIDSLLAVGVRAFGQEPEEDWERHMITRYAQD